MMNEQEVKTRIAAIHSEIDQAMTAANEVIDALPIMKALGMENDPVISAAYEMAVKTKKEMTEIREMLSNVS